MLDTLTQEYQINDLNYEAYLTRVHSVNEAINKANEALNLSKKISYNRGIADAENNLALFNMIQGQGEKAIKLANCAKSYYEKNNLNAEAASALYTIGSVYYKTSSHEKGLDYLYQALQLVKQSDDKFLESKILKAIAYIFEVFREYDKALNLYYKCVEISQSIGDLSGESNALNPISGLYIKKGNLEKAKEIVQRSIELADKTNDVRSKAFALHGLGKILLKEENFEEAESVFLGSLYIHKEVGEKLGESMSLLKLTKLFFLKPDLTSAKYYADESLKLGESISNNDTLFKANKYLYKIYKKENNLEKALEYHEEFTKFLEISLKREATNRVRSLELIYKNDLLEKEAILNKKSYEKLFKKNETINQKNTELDELNGKLSEAIDAKNKFFTIIAHDIKSPLNALIGLTNLLDNYYEGLDEAQRKDLVNKINVSSHSLLKLTQNLLDWSRIQLNKIPYEPVINDLNCLVEEAIEPLKLQAEKKKIVVSNLVEKGMTCYCDHNMISTTIRNMVSNSIKFTKSGGYATVKARIKSDFVELELADNGIGIDKENQEKLFQIQEKYLLKGTDNESGTGLGLLICKEFIEKNGGQISVESEISRGTKFRFTVPIRKSS